MTDAEKNIRDAVAKSVWVGSEPYLPEHITLKRIDVFNLLRELDKLRLAMKEVSKAVAAIAYGVDRI